MGARRVARTERDDLIEEAERMSQGRGIEARIAALRLLERQRQERLQLVDSFNLEQVGRGDEGLDRQERIRARDLENAQRNARANRAEFRRLRPTWKACRWCGRQMPLGHAKVCGAPGCENPKSKGKVRKPRMCEACKKPLPLQKAGRPRRRHPECGGRKPRPRGGIPCST